MNCLRATVRLEVERNASANRDATQHTSHDRTDQSKLIVLYVGTLDLIAKSAAGPPLASIVCSALIT